MRVVGNRTLLLAGTGKLSLLFGNTLVVYLSVQENIVSAQQNQAGSK